MTTSLKDIGYVRICCIFSGLFSVLTSIPDSARVINGYPEILLIGKIGIGAILILFGIFLKVPKQNDFNLSMIAILIMIYCIFCMWFLPLYEIAYFQVVLGLSFFKFNNKKILLIVTGLGLVGLILSHYIQMQINYKNPDITRTDLILVLIVCFLIGHIIHNYVIKKYEDDDKVLRKYYLVGHESMRLLHDVKGLLSTPILKLDTVLSDNITTKEVALKSELTEIATHLNHIKKQLAYINNLVSTTEKTHTFNIQDLINNNVSLLNSRLKNFDIKNPENRKISGRIEIFNSVIFNILLNAIQSYEIQLSAHKLIDIFWNKDILIIKTNSIYQASDSESFTGIGLKIAKQDLNSINSDLTILSKNDSTEIHLHLKNCLDKYE